MIQGLTLPVSQSVSRGPARDHSESEVYSTEVYNRKYFVNSYNNMLNYDVLITILSKNIVLITF